jgi:hypothetical protein
MIQPGRLLSLGVEQDQHDAQGLLDVARACKGMREIFEFTGVKGSPMGITADIIAHFPEGSAPAHTLVMD